MCRKRSGVSISPQRLLLVQHDRISWAGKQIRSCHREPFTHRSSQAFHEICLTQQLPFYFAIWKSIGHGLDDIRSEKGWVSFFPWSHTICCCKASSCGWAWPTFPCDLEQTQQQKQHRDSPPAPAEAEHHDAPSWETNLLQFQSLFPVSHPQAAGIANSRDLSNHLYYTCPLRIGHKVTSHHGNTYLWMEWSYHFI